MEPKINVMYVNVYEDISTSTFSVSRRYHATRADAKRAAKGTCASGRKRLISRIKVNYHDGQFD